MRPGRRRPADPDKPEDVKGTAEIAPSDIATAIKFCKVASASSRRALYQLGRAYAANRQLPEAIGAYRKAADKGSTSAMVELGVLLATGSGVAKDEAQARKLFERAAAAGNPRGVTNLAALSDGGGAPSDPVKARALLATAAATNSAEAQYQLGLMTADGVGGPKDDVAARALFEKAAAQGSSRRIGADGRICAERARRTAGCSAAKAYYEKAAALGNEEAKAALKRAQCPGVLKDKRGNVVTELCFELVGLGNMAMPVMNRKHRARHPDGRHAGAGGAVFRTWAPAARDVYVVTDAHATDHWSHWAPGSGGPPVAARGRNVGRLRPWPRRRRSVPVLDPRAGDGHRRIQARSLRPRVGRQPAVPELPMPAAGARTHIRGTMPAGDRPPSANSSSTSCTWACSGARTFRRPVTANSST